MTILNEIAERTRQRVAQRKQETTLEQLRAKAEQMDAQTGFPFEKAIAASGLSLICEVKKASPSKGVIAEDFPYVEIAKDYEEGGARAISVLTEPYWFQGKDEYVTQIREAVSLPILRKDFVVDEYMIYEAKIMGADAVLLICAILDDAQLERYFQIADGLGLSVLVEAHDQEEVDRAVKIGARMIGVNNRDLHTFTVDIHNSIRYRQSVPKEILFVSESGIKTRQDLQVLVDHGVNGVLIGETMMRAANRVEAVRQFAGCGQQDGRMKCVKKVLSQQKTQAKNF